NLYRSKLQLLLPGILKEGNIIVGNFHLSLCCCRRTTLLESDNSSLMIILNM
ncbi:unnamed protein product, partial [Dovyalis caffra]